MNVDTYNLANEKVGTAELPEEIFGVRWNGRLVGQVLRAYLANQRIPWAHAKGRGEVSGGGRKPWRQKGTGRARHGSIRSPLWRGGGKAHGPTKERDYSQKVNKKMKQGALLSVLSRKLRDNDVKVIDTLVLKEPKTKMIAKPLRSMLGLSKAGKRYDVLFVSDPDNKTLVRAARNLPKAKVLPADSLNIYDILNHKTVLIEAKAIPVMQKVYRTRT